MLHSLVIENFFMKRNSYLISIHLHVLVSVYCVFLPSSGNSSPLLAVPFCHAYACFKQETGSFEAFVRNTTITEQVHFS
jgi:hypothetical protein